jgi:acetoacetyl-CoA synthetase
LQHRSAPVFLLILTTIAAIGTLIAERPAHAQEPLRTPHTDKIYQVTAIPYTLTGKKMEVPVRRILMGVPVEKRLLRGALRFEGLEEYTDPSA